MANQDEIIWFHEVRNGQYHVGGATVPQKRELDGARAAAIEVFEVLFEETGVEQLLAKEIAVREPTPPPPRTDRHDRLIDDEHGMVELCGDAEYTSEVLYGVDPERYLEIATDLERMKSSDPEVEEG